MDLKIVLCKSFRQLFKIMQIQSAEGQRARLCSQNHEKGPSETSRTSSPATDGTVEL